MIHADQQRMFCRTAKTKRIAVKQQLTLLDSSQTKTHIELLFPCASSRLVFQTVFLGNWAEHCQNKIP